MLCVGDKLFRICVSNFDNEPFGMKLEIESCDTNDVFLVSTMYGFKNEKTSYFDKGCIYVTHSRDYDWVKILESAGLLKTIIHKRFGFDECVFDIDALSAYCPDGISDYLDTYCDGYKLLSKDEQKALNHIDVNCTDKSPKLKNIEAVKTLPRNKFIKAVGIPSSGLAAISSKTGFVNLYVPSCDVSPDGDKFIVTLHADKYYVGYLDINNIRQSTIVSACEIKTVCEIDLT